MTNSNYPYPSQVKLRRELDRQQAEKAIAHDMIEIEGCILMIKNWIVSLAAHGRSLPGEPAQIKATYYAEHLKDLAAEALDEIGTAVRKAHGVEE